MIATLRPLVGFMNWSISDRKGQGRGVATEGMSHMEWTGPLSKPKKTRPGLSPDPVGSSTSCSGLAGRLGAVVVGRGGVAGWVGADGRWAAVKEEVEGVDRIGDVEIVPVCVTSFAA